MFEHVHVPPLKTQGIKSKIYPFVRDILRRKDISSVKYWAEPFCGSCVVGFNLLPENAIFSDINPHIITFYHQLIYGDLTPERLREHLEREGELLKTSGGAHFYTVRERFNDHHAPEDFLFLSRSCFNGVMRFNAKGEFNTPFCRIPNRFANKAYLTKIFHQCQVLRQIGSVRNWRFINESFENIYSKIPEQYIVYCDPPYIGRDVGYYKKDWGMEKEAILHEKLYNDKKRFLFSTWKNDGYGRENVECFRFLQRKDIESFDVQHQYIVSGHRESYTNVNETICFRL